MGLAKNQIARCVQQNDIASKGMTFCLALRYDVKQNLCAAGCPCGDPVAQKKGAVRLIPRVPLAAPWDCTHDTRRALAAPALGLGGRRMVLLATVTFPRKRRFALRANGADKPEPQLLYGAVRSWKTRAGGTTDAN